MAVTGGLIYNGKAETLNPLNKILESLFHIRPVNVFPYRHLESIETLWTVPKTSRWVPNSYFFCLFQCFIGSNNWNPSPPSAAGILGFIVGRMSYAPTCRSKFQKIGIEGPGFGPWGGGPPFWRGGQGHRWGTLLSGVGIKEVCISQRI